MAIKNERIQQISDLMDQAIKGKRRAQDAIKYEIEGIYETEESHSTSDFPAAFQAVTNRAVLGQYERIQSVWTQYAKPYDVQNLRPQSYYSFFPDYSNLPEANGGKNTVPGGLPRVPELTEFPTFSFAASEGSWTVKKFGARVSFSFEMLLNDEWGVLESLPQELAFLAGNTEDITATEVLASATGPNTTTFTGANLIAGNPSLDIQPLLDAMNAIRARKFNGNPVVVSKFILMVPPALAAHAQQITSISGLQVTDINGTYNIANPVSEVTVVVNPWLPIIDLSANANTTWYLLPAASGGTRPAVVFSKIRGRGTPELRIATQGGQYLGGGPVPGLEGSFETDDIQFRVKHYVGAAAIATETMAASTGVGT